MANTLITPSIIAQEALFQLENNCVMASKVHQEYKEEFVGIGDTVSIRKPVKFLSKSGATRINQDVLESSRSITISEQEHVSWKFNSKDLTLTVRDYSERYIKPAVIALSNKVDSDLCQLGAQSFWNYAGTPGTTPADFAAIKNVAKVMDNAAVPDDMQRCMVLNPDARWEIADGLKAVFNAEITGGVVRKGRLGEIANFHIYGDQNIYTHTVGTFNGTVLVNDASFTNDTASIAFDGAGSNEAGFITKGDIFTIANVFDVNPISKVALPTLKRFVASAAVTTAAAAGTVIVTEALNDGSTSSSAAFQNVDSLPANNAAITIVGTASTAYPQNLSFHRNALALVMVPLELPDSVNFKAQAHSNGMSIRVVKDYSIDNDEEIIRLDILYGYSAIYPDLGVRLWG